MPLEYTVQLDKDRNQMIETLLLFVTMKYLNIMLVAKHYLCLQIKTIIFLHFNFLFHSCQQLAILYLMSFHNFV